MTRVMVIVALAVVLSGCGREEAPAPTKTEVPDVARAFGWRGNGTGRFQNVTPPTTWDGDEGTNILWQTAVGEGYSSPVLTGGKVFVTSEQDLLVCVDRKSGRILWQKDNGFESLPPAIKVEEKRPPTTCGYSTPTPVTDGNAVYACYATGIVAAYDPTGNRRWVRYFDLPQMTEYGRSASPVLVDGRLLVSISHLIALDAKTGRTLWEATDAEAAYYGTPVVTTIGDVEVVITPAGDCVRVADGRILAREIGGAEYNAPVVHDGVVYFADTVSTALKLPATPSDTIECKELWEVDLEGEFFSSPVYDDGIIYLASNEGVLFALDVGTGKTLWEKPLEIPSASGMAEPANIYPSLAIAGGMLYLANDTGTMLVLKPGRAYKEIAKNVLDDGGAACPVFDGKCLYLRGGEDLYCIGGK